MKQKTKNKLDREISKIKYYGIADAHGIESFMTEKELKESKFPFVMRADLNRQRHAVFYCAEMYKKDAESIHKLIKQGKYISALETMKCKNHAFGFPKDHEEQYGNSWDLIPNPKLDPWRSEGIKGNS